MKKKSVVLIILVVSLLFAACSKNNDDSNEVNVGYFPSISHAAAMVGVEKDFYSQSLSEVKINTKNFPNGSLFMDALSTQQIDIGYAGPGPVLNRYLQGGDVVVISDASIGENVLVVRNDIEFNSVKDLEGRIVATSSTGCTHDLILRKMLQEAGMAVEENGGNVQRITQKPAAMMGLFEQKQIDAALVSEPWASLMEAQGVARVVIDANEVPWEGNLPATVLVTRRDFLEKHPDLVEQFIEAHENSINYINTNNQETIEIIAKQIKKITQEEIEDSIIENALTRVRFTPSINKDIFQEFADLSKELGFIEGESDLTGLFWNNIKE